MRRSLLSLDPGDLQQVAARSDQLDAMLQTIWTTRSLRFWVGMGMALAVVPLAISAVVGYLIFDRVVLDSFQDVAARQRHQIQPTQHLRLLIWESVVPVDEFIDGGDPAQLAAYRILRQRIESAFAQLHANMLSDPEPRGLVERARDEWTSADQVATELISVRRRPEDPQGVELMDRFHGLTTGAVDKLGSVYDALASDLQQDHDAALLADERTEWLTCIAFAASALTIVLSVLGVGGMLSASVDRLVDGAARLAAGDRSHRIEVRVPPELRRVANEFNRMTSRIREAEEALSDLARRDSLTRLLNRRAFDEALAEAFSRLQRTGQPVALLMLDIDHFKRINDTHGHAVGDDVLRALSQVMASDVRVLDRVFRVGGEEFGVLLPGAGAMDAREVAERLRESIAETRIPIEDGEIVATVSIGVAATAKDSAPGALVEAADAALYRAKREGRDRVAVDEGDTQRSELS